MRAFTAVLLATWLALFVGCGKAGTGDGGDDDDLGVDAAVSIQQMCGDGKCAPSEAGNCDEDCGVAGPTCGNGSCDPGETVQTCGADCGGAVCGNGACEPSETAQSCAVDCGSTSACPTDPTVCLACVLDPTLCAPGLDPDICAACALGGGGGGGSMCNNDGICDPPEVLDLLCFDCE